MNCFASSIHVDLDAGVAAFASINAMQGYRPTAITQYAVQLLRAKREAKPLPAPPKPWPIQRKWTTPANMLVCFAMRIGKELVFKANGKSLLLSGTEQILLQRSSGDTFVSTVPGSFSDYSLVFARQQPAERNHSIASRRGRLWSRLVCQ